MSEDQVSGKEVIVVAIAWVAHESVRAYKAALGEDMPAWEDAPEWMMQSSIDGVVYHLANPKATPEESHKNWMAQRIRDGWAYSPVTDAKLKMHKCIVPYDQLDESDKVKDYLFKSNVDTLSKVFGVEQS